jgi:hypothetical protein
MFTFAKARTAEFRAVTVALLLAACPAVSIAAQGAGSLFVAGATHTPTHWNIQIGVPTTAEIQGVTTSEVGDPLPATITVIVKSSLFGNTSLVGTRIDATSNYSFTYTPPSIATGSAFNACETTVVSYVTEALNTNNDLLDDGLQNGSRNDASGFRFVDAEGQLISCVLGVEPSTWGQVKIRFE